MTVVTPDLIAVPVKHFLCELQSIIVTEYDRVYKASTFIHQLKSETPDEEKARLKVTEAMNDVGHAMAGYADVLDEIMILPSEMINTPNMQQAVEDALIVVVQHSYSLKSWKALSLVGRSNIRAALETTANTTVTSARGLCRVMMAIPMQSSSMVKTKRSLILAVTKLEQCIAEYSNPCLDDKSCTKETTAEHFPDAKVDRLCSIKERTIVADKITELCFHYHRTFGAGNMFVLGDGFPIEGTYALFHDGEHVCDGTLTCDDRIRFECPQDRTCKPGMMSIKMTNETADRYVCSPTGQFYFQKYVILCGLMVITLQPHTTYRVMISPNALALKAHQNSSFLFAFVDEPAKEACESSVLCHDNKDVHVYKLPSMVSDILGLTKLADNNAPRLASILFKENMHSQFYPKRIELTEVYRDV